MTVTEAAQITNSRVVVRTQLYITKEKDVQLLTPMNRVRGTRDPTHP